jgi:integrase
MARNGKSLVKLRGNTYYENFTVNGQRFRGSLQTGDKDTAEIVAAKTKSDALLGKLTGKKPEMTLTEAFARDWIERAHRLPSARTIKFYVLPLQDDKTGLGRKTLLSDLTPASLTAYRTRRLVGHANGTLNGEFSHLRTVLIRARDVWDVATPKIKWKDIFLKPREHERELSREEQERLFLELPTDLHAMVSFALEAGARLGNVIGLKWEDVKWSELHISLRVKGGGLHQIPITKKIATILSGERGRHPVFVFTCVWRKNHPDRRTGEMRLKGQRYPFAHGWRVWWYRAVKKAGLWDGKDSPDRFRFHDTRHTAASRLLRKTGNLRMVQRLLGHKNIQTTARYAHVFLDDVREGMEAEDKAQS